MNLELAGKDAVTHLANGSMEVICFTIQKRFCYGREGEQVLEKLVCGLEVSLDWSFGAGNTMVPPS